MLNPIEEAKFAELRNKCQELGVPTPPEIMIGLQVHDKNGILIFDDKQRGHSWTRNFYNLLFGLCGSGKGGGSNNFGAGYMSTKNSAAAIRYSTSYGIALGNYSVGLFSNNAADDAYGILVGTGNTAFSAEQYGLITKITNGNTSGKMAHNIMALSVPSYVAGTKTWKNTASRIFNNNSGDSITVKEVGIQSYVAAGYDGNNAYFFLERSVLNPEVPVANGAQLTVTYEISMSFAAID